MMGQKINRYVTTIYCKIVRSISPSCPLSYLYRNVKLRSGTNRVFPRVPEPKVTRKGLVDPPGTGVSCIG